MGLVKGDGKEIDHLDNNPLNNTKSNLDICTRSTNMSKRHQREIRTNKTGYKGVKISGTGYSSHIKITIGNKAHSLSLGSALSAEEASKIYEKDLKYKFTKKPLLYYKRGVESYFTLHI